jgi:hypothetical protein
LSSNISDAGWATNGKEIVVKYINTAIFDGETGKLQYFTKDDDHIWAIHHDLSANQFWTISQDNIIATFKQGSLSNFQLNDGSNVSIDDFRGDRFRQVMESQANKNKIPAKDHAKTLQSLIPLAEELQDQFIPSSQETSIDETLFII